MTEKQIQDLIYHNHATSNNILVVPCSQVFGWESDMVIVTRALLAHEFEIKVSHGDFLADKKKDKFEQFNRWMAGERSYRKFYFNGTLSYEANVSNPPNYFWYVCPKDMIAVDEVPTWAGLAYVNHYLHVVKKPVRLHKEKLPLKDVLQLCRAVNYRYWATRHP